MAPTERALLRERRTRVPLEQEDARRAIVETCNTLRNLFAPWDALNDAVRSFQLAAFDSIGTCWGMGWGLQEDEMLRQIRRFLPEGMMLLSGREVDEIRRQDLERHGVEIAEDPRLVSLRARIKEAARRSSEQGRAERERKEAEEPFRVVRSALAGDIEPVTDWPRTVTSSDVCRPVADAWHALKVRLADLDLAFGAFRDAALTTGTVPARQGPGHPPDLGRWTAATLADCLSRSTPPWTETELAAIFGSLGAVDLSTRDKVHDLLWNGPGGKRRILRSAGKRAPGKTEVLS